MVGSWLINNDNAVMVNDFEISIEIEIEIEIEM